MGGNSSGLPSEEAVMAMLKEEGGEPESYESEPEQEVADPEEEGDPSESDEPEGETEEGDGEEGEYVAEAPRKQRSAYIPRDRFDQVTGERNEARKRLEQVEPWQPVLDRLGRFLTPDDVLSQLDALEQQQVQAEMPVEAPVQPTARRSASRAQLAEIDDPAQLTEEVLEGLYADRLMATGLTASDIESMDLSAYWAGRIAFDEAQRAQAQYRADRAVSARRQAESEEQRRVNEFRADLDRTLKQYPVLGTDTLKESLVALSIAKGISLDKAAKALTDELGLVARNEKAKAAVATSRAASTRTPVGSGASPSPARRLNPVEMTSDELAKAVAGMLKFD